jgi:6-phosphogluconolactonase (cycloisomerase 2 family)
MKHVEKCAALALAAVSTVAFAQTSSSQTDTTKSPSSEVAYVYVSSAPSSGVSEIYAYSAASSGALTPVAGSPFNFGNEGLSQMAVNSKFLFASANYADIYSFSIASDGALRQLSMIDASTYNPYGSGGPGALFLDHTGTTLYDDDIYAYGTGDNAYQAFTIDESTGQLNFLQTGPDGGEIANVPLAFIGNNLYVYGAGCYQGSGAIFGYKRSSNGTLTALNITPKIPAAPPNEGAYCPYLTAPDPYGNLAVTMEPNNDISPSGPVQIAVYSADNAGNLTTTSTAANMPKTQAGPTYGIYDMWMSPSGKLLAVGGSSGLQVFHFNGSKQVTSYTGLLTKDPIAQIFWDNDNHLYAVSQSTEKLYVFTVTPTTHSQAPGSPYSITGIQGLQVLPE